MQACKCQLKTEFAVQTNILEWGSTTITNTRWNVSSFNRNTTNIPTSSTSTKHNNQQLLLNFLVKDYKSLHKQVHQVTACPTPQPTSIFYILESYECEYGIVLDDIGDCFEQVHQHLIQQHKKQLIMVILILIIMLFSQRLQQRQQIMIKYMIWFLHYYVQQQYHK